MENHEPNRDQEAGHLFEKYEETVKDSALTIYERRHRSLWGTTWEDAAQESWELYVKKLDGNPGSAEDIPILKRRAKDRGVDAARKARRTIVLPTSSDGAFSNDRRLMQEDITISDLLGQEAERNRKRRLVEKAKAHYVCLTAKQRYAFFRVIEQGATCAAVARKLKTTPQAVGQLVGRATQKLKECVKSTDGHEIRKTR
jgi:DNA-directed RNA polymerase specialized sigma24 family protein